eukprot:5633913-Pyramimonas_sp.AAC.1
MGAGFGAWRGGRTNDLLGGNSGSGNVSFDRPKVGLSLKGISPERWEDVWPAFTLHLQAPLRTACTRRRTRASPH